MDEKLRLEIYAVDSMFDVEMNANNKLIDTLKDELKKLQHGAVGIAKQTERKKKQRLKMGKEKLLTHYTLEKEAVRGRLISALKKIDADIEVYTAKKDAERKRLSEEYDVKIENYYSPHIASLYEQGSEDISDEEVIPSYSPTFYAKTAQLNELIKENEKHQKMIDLTKKALMGTLVNDIPKVDVEVVQSSKEKLEWAKMDAEAALHSKKLEDTKNQRIRQIEMASKIKWEQKEEELRKARAEAISCDMLETIKAI